MSAAKIKICGLSRLEDIEAVNRVMPEYAGFVFAQSRRQIDPINARRLKEKLDSRITAVGVFVNAPIDFIANLYEQEIIGLAQLHGDEDDTYIKNLRLACSCKIIKAVGVGSELPVLPKTADYLLFDKASKQRGGTGESLNWSLLAGYQGTPYFLAGGLSPNNVGDALKGLMPYGVDVSSGVETDGFKDPRKIDLFIQRARKQ